jgi:hypothetical protein
VISSLAPCEYTSAVSKKVTPASTARRTIGSAASSSSARGRTAGSPKLIMPRQIRDTFIPVEPKRTYSMPPPSPRAGGTIVGEAPPRPAAQAPSGSTW